MPQSLSKVYIHIIFSTKERTAFLENMGLRQELHAYLAGAAKERGSKVYRGNKAIFLEMD